MMMTVKHTPEYQRWMLQKAILFDNADLEANRQGYLTHDQRARLRRKLRWNRISRSTVVVITLMVLAGWFQLSRYPTERELPPLCINGTGVFFAVVIIGLAIESILSNGRKIRADLHKGDVSSACGKVYPGNFRFEYSLTIALPNGHWVHFDCSEALCRAFLYGGEYDVFYATHSETILSAEFIRIGEDELRRQRRKH